jgi:cytochrome c553
MYKQSSNLRKKLSSLPLLIALAVLASLAFAVQAYSQHLVTYNAQGQDNASNGLGTVVPQVVIKRVPVRYTSVNDSQGMYDQYCSSCHGAAAKGDGQAAPALRGRPTDLTMLSVRNNGKFPESHVYYVLTVAEQVPARGAEGMPAWGVVLKGFDHSHPALVRMRAANLVDYIKRHQVSYSDAVPVSQ